MSHNPAERYLFHLRIWGVIAICSLVAVCIVSLVGDYTIGKKTAYTSLEIATRVIGDRLLDSLRQGKRFDEEEELIPYAQLFSLQSVELYSPKGRLISAHGISVAKTLAPQLLKKRMNGGWPLSPWYRQSYIVKDEGRPVGIVIASISGGPVTPQRLTCLAVLLLALAGGVATFIGLRSLQTGEEEEAGMCSMAGECFRDASTVPGQTTLERSHEELEAERENALQAAESMGEFLANVSHDIRTLLNGIMGVLSLLKGSGIKGENRSLLDVASRSADSLLMIVNDILDFSKIKAGKIDFEAIPFNVRDVIEESVALFIDMARSKRTMLHCYMPVDIEEMVIGDPTRLRQVLSNLLNNAVKFTKEGSISVQVSLVQKNSDIQRLRIDVEDTGIGIARENHEKLFSMFSQAESSTSRKYGGTGLGLSMCKQLIELQHGEIGVNSSLGEGSTFWFALDFRLDKEAADTSLEEYAALNDKDILLVDDCETCRTIFSQYLHNVRVKSKALEGKDILEMLRNLQDAAYQPDIIIVSYDIARHHVKDIITGLKPLYGESVPEIYFLAKKSSLEEKLMQLGASGLILKPIRLKLLRQKLFGLAEESRRNRFSGGEYHLEGTILVVDDEPINRRVGDAMLKKMGLIPEFALSGMEACEKVARRHYDLVLMDIQMPEMSGIEAVKKIRQDEMASGRTRQPVLAITAHAVESVRQECFEAGMDGFVTKPVTPEVLYKHIANLLGQKVIEDGGGRSRTEEVSVTPAADDSDEIWDRKQALDLIGGDGPLLLELMTLFLKRQKELIVDMEAALELKDAEVISNAAHAIKGAVNHFAAKRAKSLAAGIERTARKKELEGIEQMWLTLRQAVEELESELRKEVEKRGR